VTRFTLDANVLFYAFDHRYPDKQRQAAEIIDAASRLDCPIALQAVGEFFVSIVRELKMPRGTAEKHVGEFLATFDTFPATRGAHLTGAHEAAQGRYFYWDGVLLASAAEFGCTVFLSEDMGDGARLGSIAVRNPFGENGLSDAAREVLGL
jgi:predicted nucleic acid-binding protein